MNLNMSGRWNYYLSWRSVVSASEDPMAREPALRLHSELSDQEEPLREMILIRSLQILWGSEWSRPRGASIFLKQQSQ
jgi:hypothetical protein